MPAQNLQVQVRQLEQGGSFPLVETMGLSFHGRYCCLQLTYVEFGVWRNGPLREPLPGPTATVPSVFRRSQGGRAALTHLIAWS